MIMVRARRVVVKAVSKRMDCREMMENKRRNECIYISKIGQNLIERGGRSEATDI